MGVGEWSVVNQGDDRRGGQAWAEQMHQDWRASLIVRARQERARQQKEVGGAHKAEEWFSRFITDRGIGTAREIEKASAVLHRQAQRGKKRAGQEQQSRRQRSRKNAARQDDSRPSAGSEEGRAKNRKRPLPECGSDSEAVSEGEQPAKRIAMGCAGDRHDVRPTPAVGAADHSREGVAGAELESSPMAPEPTAAVEPDGGLAMGWHTAVLEHTEDRWGNNWKQRRWVDAELKRAGVSAEAAREWGVRSVPNRTAEKWLLQRLDLASVCLYAFVRKPVLVLSTLILPSSRNSITIFGS